MVVAAVLTGSTCIAAGLELWRAVTSAVKKPSCLRISYKNGAAATYTEECAKQLAFLLLNIMVKVRKIVGVASILQTHYQHHLCACIGE